MPYVSDPNLDENEQNPSGSQGGQTAGQVSGQPSSVSGAPNSATEAPEAPKLASGTGSEAGQAVQGAAQAPYNPTKPTESGNWTNLQSYLDVNNGGQFGRYFSANIGKDVTSAKNAVSGAAQDFQSAVNANVINGDDNLLSKVRTAPTNLSDEEKANFKKQLNDSYAGPQNVANDSNFQRANAQARDAFSETQQAQNAGGQEALLKKFYSTPTYTAGSRALDSAILTADPEAQAAIQELAKQGSDLPVSFENAKTASNLAASEGAARSRAANQSAIDTLYGSGGSATDLKGGAIGDLETAISDAAARYNSEQSSLWDTISGHANSGQVTQGDLDYLAPQGAPRAGARTYGTNLSDYLSRGEGATADSAATSDQAAQLAALYDLAGHSDAFLSDPTKAGSYDPSRAIRFDSTGYQGAVNQGKASYEAQLKALNDAKAAEDAWMAAGAWSQNGYKGQIYSPADITIHNNNRADIEKKLAALQAQYAGTIDPREKNERIIYK
jgi:hypothetical protein